MALFRLIQASDLHVSTSPSWVHPYDTHGWRGFSQFASPVWRNALLLTSFSPDLASAFACEIARLAYDIDAIVVTGDLATTGSRSDLGAARDYFENTPPVEWSPIPESFISIRQDARVPLVVMPGNHDRYSAPLFTPRSDEFEKMFGDYWNFFGPTPKRFATHKYVRTTYIRKDTGMLALCTADFSLHDQNQADPLPFAYMGQGFVTNRSHSNEALLPLDELDEQTEWIISNTPDAGVIWCIHFPPKFPDGEEKLRLIGEDLLMSHASRFNIKLMLTGHTHQFKSYTAGGTRVVCCGTTMGAGSEQGNHYLDILVDTDKLQSPDIVRKVWNGKQGAFI